MASLNPFVSPNSGHKPWLDQISKNLQTQLSVTIDTPPVSIFEIPKTLKAENLEAYVPQRIGLGPYHHFQPELYQKIEQKKLTCVKRLLKPHQIHDCKHIIAKVKEIVPVVCACYDLYLHDDQDTLAWLLAIDGMFFLEQLDAHVNHDHFAIESNDLIMLENQIPVIVMMEIQKALFGDQNAHGQEDYLESKFRLFCKSYSPFLISNENVIFSRVNHLLDYMYQSVDKKETSISIKVDFAKPRSHDQPIKDAKVELLEAIVKFVGLIPQAQIFINIVEFVKQRFPEMIEEKTKVEEIKVPSVSELCKTAGIKFCLLDGNKGIRDIKFVNEKERVFYLPLINLDIHSEVTLRNLVAYERLMARNKITGYGLELTEYVDFMCGIIDDVKDVKLLREVNVIKGDLRDEEIVKLFNGIGKTHGKMSVKSELRKIVAELNKVYESTPKVLVQRFFEKLLRVSAKIIRFMVSISGVVILVHEVYCLVYCLRPRHKMLLAFLKKTWSRLLVFLIYLKELVD